MNLMLHDLLDEGVLVYLDGIKNISKNWLGMPIATNQSVLKVKLILFLYKVHKILVIFRVD